LHIVNVRLKFYRILTGKSVTQVSGRGNAESRHIKRARGREFGEGKRKK